MPRYYSPHGSMNTDYIYVCDNCEIDDGRNVLIWNMDTDKYFTLCFECLESLYTQHVLEHNPASSPELVISRKTIPEHLRNAIFTRDGNKCLKCGSQTNLTLDHIIPFSQGGKTEESNLQTLCRSCNTNKRTLVVNYAQ